MTTAPPAGAVATAAPVLPRSITAGLARLHGVAEGAGTAGTVLERLLRPVANSAWPDVAWQFSRLTGNGFPLELGFTSAGDGFRATIEVAGPEVRDADRLDLALQILRDEGLSAGPDLPAVRRSPDDLSWGAWLGCRFSAEPTTYKLYVETPASSVRLVPAWDAWRPLPSGATSELQMIGWDPASDTTELYFRTHGLTPDDVEALAARVGVAGVGELFSSIESLAGQGVPRVLAGRQIGYSVVVRRDGTAVALAVLGAGRVICGGERRVRPRLLEAARREGWDLRAYEALTRPLESHDAGLVHGFVVHVLVPGRPMQLQVGVRPIP